MSHAYLVTLAYGDQEAPTLAQVIYLSETEGEDTPTVAEAVPPRQQHRPAKAPVRLGTLRLNGTKTLDADGTASLVDACSSASASVGLCAETFLRLTADSSQRLSWRETLTITPDP